jgi:hypothetical protein
MDHYARKAGVDRIVIMKLIGHKTLSMFTGYNSVDEDSAKQALKMMDRYFAKTKLREITARLPQEQKRGSETSPNPLKLAPLVGLSSTSS